MVCAKFAYTTKHGDIKEKQQQTETEFYNLCYTTVYFYCLTKRTVYHYCL